MNVNVNDKVIIHVRGGVAELVQSPENVEVEIIDWDNIIDREESEEEDKMYCMVCGMESEEVDEDDVCPDCRMEQDRA